MDEADTEHLQEPTEPPELWDGDAQSTAFGSADPVAGRPSAWDRLRYLPHEDPRRYRDGKPIGRGGMGLVVEMYDRVLDRNLAKKILVHQSEDDPPTVEEVDRFLREARITARLDHPGVVPVHELGVDSAGHAYFTMKRVSGLDLRHILASRASGNEEWGLPRLLTVLERVCETVGFAHDRTILHRDLKPSNIMVGRFGAVYLMDWGIARSMADADEPATEGPHSPTQPPRTGDDPTPSRVIGSPPYMSPEQLRGDARALRPTADVYALGAILYQILTGSEPYGFERSASMKRIAEQVEGQPPRPIQSLAPDTPAELVAICNKAMARDPAGRYPNAQEMARDLRNYLEVRVVRAHRTGTLIELRKWVRRNRGMTATILAAVLFAITGSMGIAYQQHRLIVQERFAGESLRRKNELVEAALILEQEARRNEAEARQVSEGLRLAANSKVVADKDGSLSLLLAAEACRRAPLPESWSALQEALSGHHELRTLSGHDAYVNAGRFCADDRRAITWGEDPFAMVWDSSTGDALARLWHGGAAISCAALSPDGALAAVGDEQGGITIWSIAGTVSPPLELRPGSTPVRHMHLSGDEFVAGFADGKLIRAPLANRHPLAPACDAEEIQTIPTAGGEILALVRIDEGAGILASVGSDAVLRTLDLGDGGRLLGEVTLPPTRMASFSDAGRLMVTLGEGVAGVHETLTGRRLLVEPSCLGAAVSARGDHVVFMQHSGAGTRARTHLTPFRLAPSVEALEPIEVHGYVRDLEIGSGAGVIAFVNYGEGSFAVNLTGASLASEVTQLPAHTYTVTGMRFDSQGSHLLSTARDRAPRLWSVEPILAERVLSLDELEAGWSLAAIAPTEGPVPTLIARTREVAGSVEVQVMRPGSEDVIASVSSQPGCGANAFFSPTGESVLFRACDTEKSRWEVVRLDEPEKRGTLYTHHRELRFNKSGTCVAIGDRPWPPGSARYELFVLDSATGRERCQIKPERDYVGFEVSPDETMLATADRQFASVSIHDLATGQVIAQMDDHTSWVIDVTWSPDGKWLASTAVDSTVKVWRADTWELAKSVTGLPMAELALDWTPDGAYVVVRLPGAVQLIDPRAGSDAVFGTPTEVSRLVTSGTWVMEWSAAGTVYRHPLNPLEYLETHPTRPFTGTEFEDHRIGSDDELGELLERNAATSRRIADQTTLAEHWREAGDLDRCLAALRRANELRPDLTEITYELATTLLDRAEETRGQADLLESLDLITALLDAGALDRDAIEQSPDLAPLRELPGYRRLFE